MMTDDIKTPFFTRESANKPPADIHKMAVFRGHFQEIL
jgi:hypothetical protein